MTSHLRYRHGPIQLIRVRVDSGTVIHAGDLVYLDTDDAKPASSLTWDTNLAGTQSDFAAVFLGVAHQSSASGDTTPISVDISPLSVYEFDVPSATYEIGDRLAPDENSSALMNQQLEEVASGSLGIARAVEYKAAAATTLRVTLASAFHTGSANINAALG